VHYHRNPVQVPWIAPRRSASCPGRAAKGQFGQSGDLARRRLGKTGRGVDAGTHRRTAESKPVDAFQRIFDALDVLIFMDVLLVSASLQRLQIGDDILAILDIGNADDHLGPVYISGRIGEIFVELLLVPCDASGFEGG
jgi:hypothetical protein